MISKLPQEIRVGSPITSVFKNSKTKNTDIQQETTQTTITNLMATKEKPRQIIVLKDVLNENIVQLSDN